MVKFTLNGRQISPNQLGTELAKQVKKSATEAVTRTVQQVRCPVHQQTARVIPVGTGGEYRLEGCCDALLAAVQKKLR